jgi:hypothetical protein
LRDDALRLSACFKQRAPVTPKLGSADFGKVNFRCDQKCAERISLSGSGNDHVAMDELA